MSSPTASVLGELGLTACIRELVSRSWDVVIVGAGHNGSARAARQVDAVAGRELLFRLYQVSFHPVVNRRIIMRKTICNAAPDLVAKQASWAVCAVALLAIAGTALCGAAHAQAQTPKPARSQADETLDVWNDIGNRLVDMAKDFPEDKYDFKVQKDQRTFAQNLLHVAAVDYLLIRSAAGTKVGPDFGTDAENPSRDVYKTKADVVKLIQQAVTDGADLIKKQGDAGLNKTVKLPWGNELAHISHLWMIGAEHSGEHYGQLVVYYRANNMIPPASRPR